MKKPMDSDLKNRHFEKIENTIWCQELIFNDVFVGKII